MNKKTQYIIDAIKQHGNKAIVKVVMDGIVTMAPAKMALEQFNKPKPIRKPNWVNAEPFEEMEPVVASIEAIEPTIIEEITEIEYQAFQPKKKKKQIDESYDA